MTKAFLHGRTEAIRTVQPESVNFTKASGTAPLGPVHRSQCFQRIDVLLGSQTFGQGCCIA